VRTFNAGGTPGAIRLVNRWIQACMAGVNRLFWLAGAAVHYRVSIGGESPRLLSPSLLVSITFHGHGGGVMRALRAALAVGVVLAACSGSPAETTTTAQPPSTVTSAPQTSTTTTSTTAAATGATTSTTTTTLEEPGRGSGVIGIVGCSNSAIAAAGYDTVSERDYLTQGGLTGGSIAVWGNPGVGRYNRYWGIYDQRRPADGYTGSWLQLCVRTTEHNGSFNEDMKAWLEHIVGEIQERDPGIPIWISPVNTFEDDVVCLTIGPDGPAIAAEAADWGAENLTGVERGPDLGPISAEQIDPGETCHPNLAGQGLLGEQLVAFFD